MKEEEALADRRSRSPGLRAFSLLVCLLCLVFAIPPDALAQDGAGTRVLFMGLVDNRLNPLRDWLSSEPGVSFAIVPSRLFKGSWEQTHGTEFQDEIRRFLRIYFPRSYQGLTEYDVILFSSILVTMYTNVQLDMLLRAIRDGGACAIADTGGVMGKNQLMYGPWADSAVSEAFPCDSDKAAAYFGGAEAPNIGSFRVKLNRNASQPVFTPFLGFGIEKWRGHGGRIMFPKAGAEVWGWMEFEEFMSWERRPWVLSWEFGQALTWSIADAPRYPFWSSYERGWSDNDYGKDMWLNMMYLGSGRELVTDVALVHSARATFTAYKRGVENLISLMEFIGRFGANTDSMMDDIEALDESVDWAREAYVMQRYAESRELMEEVIDELGTISEKGVKLRREALYWVYAVEWLTVTGVSLVSGLVLYSLLVRRVLYAETGTTRSRMGSASGASGSRGESDGTD